MNPDKPLTTGQLGQAAAAAERARKAWTVRVAGGSWTQAAHVAGFTDPGNCVRAVRNYFGALPQVDASEERELWRQRLERLWGLALREAEQSRPGALRAGVAVAQRASAMLGLDAPVQLQAQVSVRSDEMILHVIAHGGLPTLEERDRYGITDEEIHRLRLEAGLDAVRDG